VIDDLATALRDEELKLYDEETLAELRTFVRDDAGRMNGSPFDDRVMSLAIANHLRQFVYLPEYATKQDNYMTFEWWANVGKETQDPDWVIGQRSTRSPKRTAGSYGWR
jgi:hypothetical protein